MEAHQREVLNVSGIRRVDIDFQKPRANNRHSSREIIPRACSGKEHPNSSEYREASPILETISLRAPDSRSLDE